MLLARDITFRYHRRAEPVIRDLTAPFEAGRVTAIVGPNGAGKTTLLRLLLGLARPDAGSVTLDDRPLGKIGRPSTNLAYVPKSPASGFEYTTAEVVGFAVRDLPADLRDGRVASALARVDLAERSGVTFNHLSDGQRQRAAIARAIAQFDRHSDGKALAETGTPRYILADEPTSAQDPRHALGVLDLLRDLAREDQIGVIAVMHDLALAARFADDAVVLNARGGVAALGPAAETLTPEHLEPVFGVRFAELASGDHRALVATMPGA